MRYLTDDASQWAKTLEAHWSHKIGKCQIKYREQVVIYDDLAVYFCAVTGNRREQEPVRTRVKKAKILKISDCMQQFSPTKLEKLRKAIFVPEFCSYFGNLKIYTSVQNDVLCPDIVTFKPFFVKDYMRTAIHDIGKDLAVPHVGLEGYAQLLPMQIWERYVVPHARQVQGRNF